LDEYKERCCSELTPDIDIHRSAWLMIRRYGDDAAAQAARREKKS